MIVSIIMIIIYYNTACIMLSYIRMLKKLFNFDIGTGVGYEFLQTARGKN